MKKDHLLGHEKTILKILMDKIYNLYMSYLQRSNKMQKNK